MINRLMVLAMIPAWVWVLLLVMGGCSGMLAVVVLAVGGVTSPSAADLSYQCDSAVGPDPSSTATVVASTTAIASGGSRSVGTASARSSIPTTNPYAELTIAPDDTDASEWQRACVSALKSAPYQLPPLQTTMSGLLGDCARELAINHALKASSGSADGAPSGPSSAAGLTRDVIYQASAGAVTGRCDPTALPPDDTAPATVAPTASGTSAQPGSAAVACGQSSSIGKAVIVLPKTIAAQAACGQRVDPAAVSAGDLVFWDYRSNAPTRTGIALGATQVMTYDAYSGRFVEQSMPTGRDVRIKRVLGGGS
ncbi:hypothetical protein OIE68_20055 [Nocardia vinacea]|uniref:hypothetical protein n=1 Tax=Nocardia vinacea TaxID=96468 RepID=UPI002E0E84A5|nr:hypothetical protein OIE68_20055 [Nocardia vinacea]